LEEGLKGGLMPAKLTCGAPNVLVRRVDVGIDVGVDVCVDVCVDVSVNVCVDVCVDIDVDVLLLEDVDIAS
jgi:hypothetical protein